MAPNDEVIVADAQSGEPTPISDLDLYHLSWETPAFSADPYTEFEAARANHSWLATVNGGFMVFDSRRIWDYLDEGEGLVFEKEPLTRMARDGQLGIYQHEGYWQCMDTYREYNLLNDIWSGGNAPWKIW